MTGLTIVEIQYLRGLVHANRIEEDYENVGRGALIDRETTMNEFTLGILDKLDRMEATE